MGTRLNHVFFFLQLIHSLISHLVSGLVDPCNPESAQVVRLITSILTHQGNVSLSSETSDRVIVWISDTLRFNLHKPENEIPVQETLCAMSVVLRDAPDHTDEVSVIIVLMSFLNFCFLLL